MTWAAEATDPPAVNTVHDGGRTRLAVHKLNARENETGNMSAKEVEDEAARVRIAAKATQPDTLNTLAADGAVTVRAAVALNPLFAQAANLRLASDPDTRVRVLLAGKIARLLPGLSGPEHSAAQQHVRQMLLMLADDAAMKVRTAIADVVTTMPEAPKDVILKLAHDPVVAVSDPVIRLSPLLSDADLLELLATPPNPGTAVSVASRPGLGAEVADVIVFHAGSVAVTALLSNSSASIQEATLDALVGRAGDHPEWHEPLVRRPTLSARALGSLTRFVAGHLLDILVNRADLPLAVAEDLRGRLAENLSEKPAVVNEADLLESIQRIKASGHLHEAALLEAAAAGDARTTAAILAVASDTSIATVDRAILLRSAKGLVSLTHRAGFTMHAGAVVQTTLGLLGPGETLAPTSEGGFPLSAGEMDWQIELLGEPGR